MKRKLYQLVVPLSIKEKLYQMNVEQYQQDETRRRKMIEQDLPPVELSPVYIQHLKVVANLNELLKMMPGNAIAAEVGSGSAMLSETILTINHPAKLLLFDDWSEPPNQDGSLKIVLNKFKEEIRSGVVEVCNGNPAIELAKLPDGSLDWIFLRSDNSYQATLCLLDLSRRKVKTGGIISGCNYSVGHWTTMQRYGVIESVNKFCKEYGWEMICLTNESNRQLNYALKKISVDNNKYK